MRLDHLVAVPLAASLSMCAQTKGSVKSHPPTPRERAVADYGQKEPSPRWVRYITLMDEYNAMFSQVRSLKTRTILDPATEQDSVLGSCSIGLDSVQPKAGERLELQIRISLIKDRYQDGKTLLPALENMELMYELTVSDGLMIVDSPRLPLRSYRGGDYVQIYVPVVVLNSDVQLIKLHVCAYQNDQLKDWQYDHVALNTVDKGVFPLDPLRKVVVDLKKAAQGRRVVVFDSNGQLVDPGMR